MPILQLALIVTPVEVMPVWQKVLIVVSILVIIFSVAEIAFKAGRRRAATLLHEATEGSPMSRPLTPSLREEPRQETSPEPQSRPIKENPLPKFRSALKDNLARGKNISDAVLSSMEISGGDVSLGEALNEAVSAGCSATDLVALMAKRDYSLQEIAEFLFNHDVEYAGAAKALFAVAEGESSADKAEKVFEATHETYNLEGEEESVVNVFTEFGCRKEEIAEILHRKTDLHLAEVIAKMELGNSSETVAALAKKMDVDLSETDEYHALRESGIEFADAAAILKACGKNATEVLDAENEHNNISLGEFEEISTSLEKAGFAKREVLEGVCSSDFTDDDTVSQVVAVAYDSGMPLGDIVAVVKDKTDLDDLDEGLRDDDVEIKTRVKILHAFLLENEKSEGQEMTASAETN